MLWLVSLCYFFSWGLLPAFPESWHCHPSGCGLCAKPGGSNLNGNQGGLVSPASLPHSSTSTRARFLMKKTPLNWCLQVRCHEHTCSGWRSQEMVFDVDQKTQEHPFILPFFSKIVAATAHLPWFRDWQGLGHTLCDSRASGGGGWRKKQLHFMFYLPLCFLFIIL